MIDKMPSWFEFIFNTPSHHRMHHGRNRDCLDCNYGGVLIIYDRIFGTFRGEAGYQLCKDLDDVSGRKTEPITYGLVENVNSFNFNNLQFTKLINNLSDYVNSNNLTKSFRTL